MSESAEKPQRETIVRAAVKADVHPATIERYIRERGLSVEWHAGRRLVDVAELEALLRQRTQRRAGSGAP